MIMINPEASYDAMNTIIDPQGVTSSGRFPIATTITPPDQDTLTNSHLHFSFKNPSRRHLFWCISSALVVSLTSGNIYLAIATASMTRNP